MFMPNSDMKHSLEREHALKARYDLQQFIFFGVAIEIAVVIGKWFKFDSLV